MHSNFHARKLLEKMKLTTGSAYGGEVVITRHEFELFAVRHPALLFPAFTLQREMQRRIMGNRFWDKATTAREKLFPAGDGYKELLGELTDLEFRKLVDSPDAMPYSSPKPPRKPTSGHGPASRTPGALPPGARRPAAGSAGSARSVASGVGSGSGAGSAANRVTWAPHVTTTHGGPKVPGSAPSKYAHMGRTGKAVARAAAASKVQQRQGARR